MRSRWTTGGDSCTMIQQNCGDTEGKREPGEERPVQAQEEAERQIHPLVRRREAERTRVAKPVSRLSRKAAMACIIPVP